MQGSLLWEASCLESHVMQPHGRSMRQLCRRSTRRHVLQRLHAEGGGGGRGGEGMEFGMHVHSATGHMPPPTRPARRPRHTQPNTRTQRAPRAPKPTITTGTSRTMRSTAGCRPTCTPTAQSPTSRGARTRGAWTPWGWACGARVKAAHLMPMLLACFPRRGLGEWGHRHPCPLLSSPTPTCCGCANAKPINKPSMPAETGR